MTVLKYIVQWNQCLCWRVRVNAARGGGQEYGYAVWPPHRAPLPRVTWPHGRGNYIFRNVLITGGPSPWPARRSASKRRTSATTTTNHSTSYHPKHTCRTLCITSSICMYSTTTWTLVLLSWTKSLLNEILFITFHHWLQAKTDMCTKSYAY